MPTRFRHRIPVRIRHYWKLLVGCAAVLVTLAVVFSTVRVAPLVTSASDEPGDEVTRNVEGSKDLFDAAQGHSIKLTYRDGDYQRLIDSLWDEGEKEYLEADLTIDGVNVPSVGIRLKGNSSLAGLTRDGQSRPGGFGGIGGKAGFGSLKVEEPETLPWLIRFDEFVEGRRYQGHREVAVRVAGMGGGKAVLSEAISLDVLAATGQPAQRYAYTSFVVNDRPATARLIVEHPDEGFAGRIGDSGVLYKSRATSQFTDQGDDQTDYADDFKQINLNGSQDLQPVIDLIRWVNSAGDAEFDEHLDDYVDVASFARYLATQNLLLNSDDMAGPGRNYYLWYDLTTKRFSVVGWDYNLTLSGNAEQDPSAAVSMNLPPLDGAGGEPPGGGGPGGAPGGGPGGGPAGGHKLKERFLASDAFTTTYRDAYRDMYRKVYGSGAATRALDAALTVLSTIEGYDQEANKSEVDRLRTLLSRRATFLAGNAIVNGP